MRRVIGVAPWGARSSSLPGYLRLSASSRVLFLMFSSVVSLWCLLCPALPPLLGRLPPVVPLRPPARPAGYAWPSVPLSIVSVTLLPLNRHVLVYTRAAHMAPYWVDCSVCLVAAPFGAWLPIAATVGTFPTACR